MAIRIVSFLALLLSALALGFVLNKLSARIGL
jgi:hypothetical protein